MRLTVKLGLERRLAPWLTPFGSSNETERLDDSAFDPESLTDERKRQLRAIRIRQGQPAFRATLLNAYANRCAITGCPVEDVLEAAHIIPYLGPRTNHVSNGLLLRTDIHTLFDCWQLAIDPDTRRVVITEALRSSSYAKIAGKLLRSPMDEMLGPRKQNLETRFAMFETAQKWRAKGLVRGEMLIVATDSIS